MAELELRLADGLAVIRLARPEMRNAVNAELSRELRAAVLEVLDVASAIAIEGEGEVFCSGGDMSALEQDDGLALSVMAEMRETLRILHGAPIPVAAFVDALAVGGGAEIAAAAHLVCAAPSARFGFIQRRVGLVPGWGGGAYLSERVGRGRAMELVLSGRIISAQEAQAIGLVDVILPAGSWPQRQDLLQGLGRAEAEALVASLRVGEEARAVRLFDALWTGERHREAVRGFLGRR